VDIDQRLFVDPGTVIGHPNQNILIARNPGDKRDEDIDLQVVAPFLKPVLDAVFNDRLQDEFRAIMPFQIDVGMN
jgi:hypothetical protein